MARTDAPSRRDFLKTTSAVAAGALAADLLRPAAAHAYVGSSDVIRVGLIGCGNRGNGAAIQALTADENTQLTAVADLFPDKLERSLETIQKDKKTADRAAVPADKRFVGIDAYKQLIDSGVDLVLLCTPPQFRPAHLRAAVDAGKHVFCEKPVAVDAPGVRKVIEAVEIARKKNLALTSGLNWRYDAGAREAIKRVHDGQIGDVVALQSSFSVGLPGKPWPMVREDGWSEMEFQLRNWYWFTWLSGDHIVEQAIHSMDKGQWAIRDVPPASAWSLGGLQARAGEPRGQIFDHHAVLFEYDSGIRHYHYCRQQVGCANDVSTHVLGTRGSCHIDRGIIRDSKNEIVWRFEGKKRPSHQAEHDELFANLRSGTIRNDGDYMAKSTLMAILGRMASYTGKKVTWDQAANSTEDLTPPSYDFGPHPVPPVAVPGVTRLSES